MKKLILIMFFPVIVLGQNNVCFEITENPNANDPALGVFTKYVSVLDCFEIYAESNISDDKVLHAAAIAAELLDNNEDGSVDDPAIKVALANANALMPIFSSEGSNAEEAFMDNYEGEGVSAVLYKNEMNPSMPGHWGEDATVEEILHTINHVGHVNVYPEAFSVTPNSSLMTDAMDVARGGQYTSIPNNYPEEAWYHYDDATCDYGCMAIEYMYWSIVSYMGILDDVSTCDGIANEWECCTPELFESTDTLMYNLITNPMYNLPLNAPDGNYCPQGLGMSDITSLFKIVGPNPANQTFKIESKINQKYALFDYGGRMLRVDFLFEGVNYIEVSGLPDGLYFIKIGTLTQKMIVTH